MSRLITLLTDFGLNDVYVGVMKGVIAQINPALKVVDLTHQVPPQNVAIACFHLLSAYLYFPSDTVHVAVVDPGVGGLRRAIAIESAEGFWVGPDNGLFNGVLQQSPAIAIVELTNRDYWRTPEPSTTFHGRDIFAAVGAHLANGVALTDLGPKIEPQTLVQLAVPQYSRTDAGIMGAVQYIDRFGNLVTNIPGHEVMGQNWVLTLGKITMPGYVTYSDSAYGKPLALIGSHGWVEIAVNSGDAQFQLRAAIGDDVKITFNQ
ncbi:MAG: SAM-dependent chlorinase/fluorinase [Cyanothece sp. SIO1E1]|nr:SAM-dependent chlorinase/fluorinase [Cyanothece sp. SIO1E1]